LDKFNSELKLDASQQDAVKAVLGSYRTQMKALHEDHAKRFGEIRAAMRADIAKLLTPEQLKRFQGIQSRWDAHHKNWK
jgi:Spy/CpxP family protein refolding chaperone